ncbi:hypothetical protein SAMN05216351_10754 [Pseudobutyrivibrio sp. JW11]|uniref:hypothetical protein n=1 Tax=Pseudobutyrivibrio sp. JW11 TaxID=1855302 RepID=UPI0008E12F15|nr:hypothetical protein [Pseudobutyrivibrio sp. JW11]SFO35496.1 hypothetical protein SAMN05216351_10754 [Pseudobutyrivibrio sp. JW11]
MNVLKNNKSKIIIGVLYFILFIPVFYSIYYSVPASDDFAMALGRDAYGNVVSEFIAAVVFFWTKRGGTICSFVAEYLINPLNLHVHLGHWYGIYMIIAFIICMFLIYMGLKKLVFYVLKDADNAPFASEIITFLVIFMLIENYYYVETYNWYVGMISYAGVMALLFLNIFLTLRFAETGKKSAYVWMIVTGVIVANTSAFDIPLGAFFVYIVLFNKEFDKFVSSIFKKVLPLLLYIAMGLITIMAPGNYARQSQYTEGVSVGTALRQTVADVQFFGMAIIKERPVTLIIAVMLVLLGFAVNNKQRKRPGNIILYGIVAVCVWIGCILPYVYGRGMTRTYLDVRMQYVLDYFIEIGICIGCVMLGQWIAYIIKVDLSKAAYIATCAVAVLGVAALVATGRYATTVTYEVYAKHADIAASYDLWNGILLEIENSSDSDVTVDRDYNVSWNKYFLYSGMEPGEVYAVELDSLYDSQQILPNVYYKKNSITVNYPR